jgi:hypothetical protein
MTKTIEADVVIVGGGPAGINAAIAAGRRGVSTVLIERYGFVGGMTTAALVYPWMTFHTMEGKQVIRGIAQEIVDRLIERGGSPGHMRDTIGFVRMLTPFHPEIYKVLILDIFREAGVRLLLHSFVDEVRVAGDRIESVVLTGKAGRIEVKGRQFVDASGDADVARLAGVPFRQGRGEDRLTQPMTMKFRMRGVDLGKVRRYMLDHPDEFYKKTPFDELPELPLTGVLGFYKHWKEAELPINRDQVLFFAGPEEDEVLVNTTRVQGLDGTDTEDLTRAEEIGRRQVLMVAEFMRSRLPGFERASLSQVGVRIGVRETRRIEGMYTPQASDVLEGRKFADCVARSGYPIDIHDPAGKGVRAAWVGGDGAYDIPYRCLVPRAITNLLSARRCISTSHEAQATTRLSPGCMATGQAAGTAAAMAAKKNVPPIEIDIFELQDELRKDGACLE